MKTYRDGEPDGRLGAPAPQVAGQNKPREKERIA